MTKLTYRDLRESDVDALHDVCSDWDVVRQLGGWPWPPQKAFTASRCQPYAAEGFVWGICHDDVVIGTLGMTKGELGYMLHKDHHGRGIMTASVAQAITVAFDRYPQWKELKASTWIDNPASHKLLCNFGFSHYRTEYIRSKARGFPVVVRQYRLPRPA